MISLEFFNYKWYNTIYACVAQPVVQLIRNEQVAGSNPVTSSKTCVNTAFSQVFSFSKMHFKIQFAIKNLTFYRVRFYLFIRFFVQDRMSIQLFLCKLYLSLIQYVIIIITK